MLEELWKKSGHLVDRTNIEKEKQNKKLAEQVKIKQNKIFEDGQKNQEGSSGLIDNG